jgi:DNA-binding transcriptional MerR regulator
MKLLTTTQLAERFGVSPQCVRKWYADGRIEPAMKLPSGQPLYAASTKRPDPLKRGPKPA